MNHPQLSHSEESSFRTACLSAFFDSFPDAVIVWSLGAGLVFANQAAGELLEHSVKDLAREIFADPLSIFGPEAASRLPGFFREENTTGFASAILPIRCKSGRKLRVEVRSSLLHIGGKRFRCMILRDISTAAAIPAAPRSGETGAFPDVVSEAFTEEQEIEFELGEDGLFSAVNDVGVAKSGYTRHEFRAGLHFTDLLIPDDRARARRDFDRLRRTARLDALEYTVLRANGEPLPIILSLTSRAGRVHGVGFDISEHKQIEHDLLAREKLSALGELTTGVVHNFNNILAVILGYLALVPEKGMDEGCLKILRGIRKAAVDGTDMVKRIQNFSRPENSTAKETADLNIIIRDVLDYLAPRWIGADPEIRMVPRLGEIPPVSVVPFEMREVLSNIIINALDAMPDGGTLTVGTFAEGRQVGVSVADTGIGMSPETKRRLFEPFFTTKKEKGNGIGLSVSRAIVTKFDGEISVKSAEGEGTTITILLPRAETEPSGESGAPLPGGRSILVLDDEENICEILREFLSRDGHEVVTARRGEDGLELLEKRPFDILITDLNMPGVSGWELARQVRRDAPETLIIMLTGWGSQVEHLNRRERIIDHILHKPIDFSRLNKIIAGEK